jgi:lysozyme family protein
MSQILGLLNIFQKPSPLANEKPQKKVKLVNEGNPQRPDFIYLWDNCVLDEAAKPQAELICKKILENKQRYLAVEKKTGISWFWIAAIHYRETSLSFKAAFHNGDPIIGTGRLTYNVPSGRGAFDTWEESVYDAVKLLKLDQISTWDIYTCLSIAERYNGFGYRRQKNEFGVSEYSPYVWAGTNNSDETGKYTADGKFDPYAREKQLGVAAIFLHLGV